MCGIAGIASLNENKIDENILKRMRDVLRHRGPDDEGIYISRTENPNSRLKVGLGHRRLSIIDIEGGHQPMSNEAKTIWMVYNGEVYNFPELKKKLIKKGHRFKTKTDTEIIIHLYEDKGIACLDDLRGMFAFAIWDAKLNKLFLARDRVGQKPLFYYCKDNIFLFGSEIKAILEHESVKRTLDLASLDTYLSYGYITPPSTIFKGIKKLLPAHYLTYDGSEIKTECYWSLDYTKRKELKIADCERQLYDILGQATKMRLISDVPLGAFLSGGVDSSCIVSLMKDFSSKKVRTFSIGFDEENYNELKYARYVSQKFNTEHKELLVRPRALDILPKLAWHYDQPFGDSSCIPTYYVSKMTRDFVTVALNGDGGDESFGGYHRYKGVKLAELLKFLPKAAFKAGYNLTKFIDKNINKNSMLISTEYGQRFLGGLAKSHGSLGAYASWITHFSDDEKETLYSKGAKATILSGRGNSYLNEIIKDSSAKDAIEKAMEADVRTYLPEDLLVKVDIATMANSLEGRSPFLDHKVMEFAASMPVDYKLRGFNTKYILKDTFKGKMPISFLNRKKKGFGIPVGKWFSGELKGFVKDMLLDKKAFKKDIFSKAQVESLVNEHQQGRRDHTHRLWMLLSFEMWHRIFIDRQRL